MSDEYKRALSELFAAEAFPEDAFFLPGTFGGRKIVVYGAGESFHYFKEVVIRKYGYVPSVVLDRRFKPGDSFEGIPAFSPLEYEPSADDKENALVVVCLGKQPYFDEVLRTLRRIGFRHIISLMDIYEIHNPFDLPSELERDGFRFYSDKRRQIESCLELLEDDESREIFVRSLRTHMRRKPVPVPMRDRNEQYTPKDIPLSRGYSRFIYCGVSVGELARVFTQVGKIEELVCFEPDPNQFKLTAEYLSSHHEQIARRLTAIPCAVYRHEAVKPFIYSDTSFGSRILESYPIGAASSRERCGMISGLELSGSSVTSVQCVSIDSVLPGFQPTFINMDIEGAELEALKGAEKTLTIDRPDLAVCVYHSPNHLWEIPLYLHGLGIGYRFYLRNYTTFTGETVLYATS